MSFINDMVFGTKIQDVTYFETSKNIFEPIKCDKNHEIIRFAPWLRIFYYDSKTKKWEDYDSDFDETKHPKISNDSDRKISYRCHECNKDYSPYQITTQENEN